MRTYRFFEGEILPLGSDQKLTPENSRIASSVLRCKNGDRITLINGQGKTATAELIRMGKEHASVRIVEEFNSNPAWPQITLLQGLPKGEKSEWIVSKATEWGIARIIFFESQHTVAKKGKSNERRWKKAAVEALRQSGNPFLPEILGPLPLPQAIEISKAKLKIILDENEKANSLKSWILDPPPASLVLAVGAEGGWSNTERVLFENEGYHSARLGPYILRAETAAICAIAILRALTAR